MDFSFSEEQQMLLDTTRRFMGERYGFEARMKLRDAGGWSPQVWRELGELGLLAINVPEADGGLDAGPVGTHLVAMAMGEGLGLEPFIGSAVVATTALVRTSAGSQRERLLAGLMGGETIAVLAHDDADDAVTQATQDGDGWRINGRKTMVYHAPIAGLLLVSAQVGDATALFAVPADADGVSVERFTTVDDQLAGHVAFDNVSVDADALLSTDASDAIRDSLDLGLAALCADALGAMVKILDATIEYSRARMQFGTPIGRFQALQHRMADMLMHLEQARSMAYLAATRAGDRDSEAHAADLSAAKALMGQAARHIAQQAVQLHGGMGMTDELDVSHWFRRLLAFELRAGTTDEHLERYRRLAVEA
jgi:alkylation response protein AidB-like acyl-CoA dehydrogenase